MKWDGGKNEVVWGEWSRAWISICEDEVEILRVQQAAGIMNLVLLNDCRCLPSSLLATDLASLQFSLHTAINFMRGRLTRSKSLDQLRLTIPGRLNTLLWHYRLATIGLIWNLLPIFILKNSKQDSLVAIIMWIYHSSPKAQDKVRVSSTFCLYGSSKLCNHVFQIQILYLINVSDSMIVCIFQSLSSDTT